MIDTDRLELLLRYVVLPVIIGLFTVAVVLIYDSTKARREDDKENHKDQLHGAKDTCSKVMVDAERLLSIMRYHAWNIAWRKMRPEGIFSEDLIEEDEKNWRLYDEALMQWRRNKIQYKTAIEVSFGKREAASKLFKLVDATFDKLSFELWFIYHENPSNPNVFLQYFVEDIDQKYDTVFNAIMTSIDKVLTREQEENVHSTTSVAFDELQDKINRMCFEMTESIRRRNVGNLRTGGRQMGRKKKSSARIKSS